jgi:hypothetical protein
MAGSRQGMAYENQQQVYIRSQGSIKKPVQLKLDGLFLAKRPYFLYFCTLIHLT